MAKIPEYPPILTGNTQKDMAEMRSFLMRLVQEVAQLNTEIEKISRASEASGS